MSSDALTPRSEDICVVTASSLSSVASSSSASAAAPCRVNCIVASTASRLAESSVMLFAMGMVSVSRLSAKSDRSTTSSTPCCRPRRRPPLPSLVVARRTTQSGETSWHAASISPRRLSTSSLVSTWTRRVHACVTCTTTSVSLLLLPMAAARRLSATSRAERASLGGSCTSMLTEYDFGA